MTTLQITPAAPKAYSYLRFSSPEQAKGASQKRQIEAAASWAAGRGMKLDEELRDEGISAFKGKNREPTSALGGFLARVQSGDVAKGSFLLVESFDRLSREEVVDALELFLGLTRAGIAVVTLADGRIYNRESLRKDQTQLIISIVIMTRAFEESAMKSRRVGDAWSRKRQSARDRGQAMTSICPGWIQLLGGPRAGCYELIPERAAIVRDMFQNVIAGDGRRTVVKRLNAAGIEPWGVGGKKGKFWHDSYVQKILDSPAVFGRYDKGDDRLDNYFPAVVSEETYWKARAAAASRYAGQGRTTRGFANLLYGLAKCAVCDDSMRYVDKGKRSRPKLVCARALSSAGCTMRTGVTYGLIERGLIHAYAHFADAAMFAIAEDAKAAAEKIGAIENQRQDTVIRRDRLIAAVEAGQPIPPIRKRLDELSLEISKLEQDIATLRATAADESKLDEDIEYRIDTIMDLISADDLEDRYRGRAQVNARLRRVLERIIVQGNGGLEFIFKPGFEDIDRQMVAMYKSTRLETSVALRG